MKIKIKKYFFTLFLLLAGTIGLKAQITIGKQVNPHGGALLDLQQSNASTQMGLKLPVVSLADVSQYGLTSGGSATATGMVVYNTNPDIANGRGVGVYFWDGTKWLITGSAGSTETPEVTATRVRLNKPTTTIVVGSTETLVATVSPSDLADKSVTWASTNESVATVSDGIVTAIQAGPTTIIVKTVDGNKVATCSVDVIQEAGTVEVAGLIFMDRNLGADPTANPNPLTYDAGSHIAADGILNGDYYQWGRQADGHEKWNSVCVADRYAYSNDVGGTEPDVDDSIDGKGQVKSTSPLYGLFIGGTTFKDDWRQMKNDNLWNETGTGLVNPCPEGFRIPSMAEWNAVVDVIRTSGSLVDGSNREGINVGTSNLFLPAAGYRGLRYGINSTQNGDVGRYWSSTASSTGAVGLHFRAYYKELSVNTFGRAMGMPVRCVKKK